MEMETVLVPICEYDHWILMVVKPKSQTVYILNSLVKGKYDEKEQTLVDLWRYIIEYNPIEDITNNLSCNYNPTTISNILLQQIL